ncbi:unnamed protein product [Prorocentrum cordatum]|uniref:2Fe-2S ferredoxin-type domain-containing protein n=1 Tax=Prorocentrum cordatum TaxID=2364126 RepID=A0ABN9RK13_9DINO|nr:unnamed protein product [Polarella glacialis]
MLFPYNNSNMNSRVSPDGFSAGAGACPRPSAGSARRRVVLAVEGTPCEGDLDKVVELVMGSPGDKVTITLCRNYLRSPKGPIKVVFRPSGGMATVGRGNNFTDIASSVQEDVNYSCQEGWCGSCWHREVATGKVVRMCTDEVPGVWDNVMPMTLVAAPETNRKE